MSRRAAVRSGAFQSPLESAVYFAVFVFVAGVVTRYFEYLWQKMEGAFAFLSIGALLLAVGWLVENRRRVLRARIAGERS